MPNSGGAGQEISAHRGRLKKKNRGNSSRCSPPQNEITTKVGEDGPQLNKKKKQLRDEGKKESKVN